MTRLSVNINKIALLRNSRGGNVPDPLAVALDCERFGADGITVHPRPDARHIRYHDVRLLKSRLQSELNIEGNPYEPSFMDLVLEIRPQQVTLVPDEPAQLTSDHGWDLAMHAERLAPLVEQFQAAGIRVSAFIDPSPVHAQRAAHLGFDAVELYTESYAKHYGGSVPTSELLSPYVDTARVATDLGLLVNAGHDLNLANLGALHQHIPWLHEVSIGHALVSDALYLGLENTVRLYARILQKPLSGG